MRVRLRISKKSSKFAADFERRVMTRLSVNINKVATLRNARGGNLPDVQRFAVDCELFGAQGITVHPRPDERHIRKEDVYQLKSMVTTELNVEGNPTEEFLALVTDIRPTQVTLVPDDPNQLTSNHGWDTRRHLDFLKGVVNELHAYRIRVSIFVDPDPEMVEYALRTGADRVELYTVMTLTSRTSSLSSRLSHGLQRCLSVTRSCVTPSISASRRLFKNTLSA